VTGSDAPGPETARRPRLNPFAFPSDTTFRFVLLVLAVCGATLYVWQWIYFAVGISGAEFLQRSRTCQALAPPPTANLDDYTASSGPYRTCVQEGTQSMAWWMLAGLALVLVLAVVLTLLRPWWKARRSRLRPLRVEDAPAVVAEVHELGREAGLRATPHLVWNPLASAPTGLAYGYPGRYTVALTGGLVVRQATDPEAFRAVVRHELAHIRNRDVDLTYFAVSLWHAFLIGAVVPFALTLIDEGGEALLRVTWRLLALAALVYLTRNAVLRSREVYADVRASVGDGRPGIERVLAGLPRPSATPWRRLLRVHPDPADRLAIVADTRPLFRLELLTSFGAGVAATTSYESFVDIVAAFVADPLDIRFVAALAFAPAIVGVVGLGIWRAGFAALAEGRQPPPVWPLALALTAGFLLGPELALQGALVSRGDTLLTDVLQGEGLLWLAGLVAALVLLLAWVNACASAWIRALVGRRSRIAAAAALLAATGVLTIVMGVFYTSRDLRPVIDVSKQLSAFEHEAISQVTWAMPEWAYQLVANPQLVWTLLRPELMPAVVLVVGLPLAAALVRRDVPTAADTSWAFLDPGGRLAVPMLALRLLRPLLVGLAAGAVFLAATLVLRLGVHNGIDSATRAQDAFILGFFSWNLALAVLVQAAAGAVATAISAHRARVLDGLGAAFVAGSIATFGIVAGPTAGGCVDTFSLNPGPCSWDVEGSFVWDVFRRLVELGTLAALATSLLTLGVVSLVRRSVAHDELRPAASS
jgi:Zn-dependent protease with chaperone function